MNAKLQSAIHLAPVDRLPTDPELATHRALVLPTEPIAYAYVDLDSFGKDEAGLRWAKLAETLSAEGASDAAVAALAERVLTAPQSPATLAVFADGAGSVLHAQVLTDLRMANRAGFSAPACIVPLLKWAQDRPAFVLAAVDRTGADLTAGCGGGATAHTDSVVGPDDEIERNAPGGWAQPRYQRRAEDSWRHNAAAVADAIEAAIAKVHAEVLVLTGDVRALQLLTERLTLPTGLTVQQLSGSRSPDGSQSRRPGELERILREAAAYRTEQMLERFQARLYPEGLAVQGTVATMAAIAADRVSYLLVSSEPSAGPITNVAIRAALLSGAQVRTIDPQAPDGPVEGLGALCRFVER